MNGPHGHHWVTLWLWLMIDVSISSHCWGDWPTFDALTNQLWSGSKPSLISNSWHQVTCIFRDIYLGVNTTRVWISLSWVCGSSPRNLMTSVRPFRQAIARPTATILYVLASYMLHLLLVDAAALVPLLYPWTIHYSVVTLNGSANQIRFSDA